MVTIVSLLFAGVLTVQFPQVQTMLADKLVRKVSEKIDGEITFEKIHFKPFTTLVVKNAVITDRNPAQDPWQTGEPVDTFFRAEYIIASFTLDGLIKQEGLHLRTAFIDNAQMNLVLEEKDDSTGTLAKTDNLSRIFRLKKSDPDKPKNMNEIFHIKKVEIRNMGFAMKNYQMLRPEFDFDSGIDWNDLDIRDIDIQARELMFKEGKMSGVADKISFTEKSGYRVESIAGKTIVGGGKTIIEELSIIDLWSDIKLSSFMMSYKNPKSFSEFITDVKMDGIIEPSVLDFTTISYFAPALKGNKLKTSVKGVVSGYVDDFTISDLAIASKQGGFSGKVNGRIHGLPDIHNTAIQADIDRFRITSEGLGKFVTHWMPEGELDLSRFAAGTTFTLDSKVNGLLNNMDIAAEITSSSGDLSAKINMTDVADPEKPIIFAGNAQTYDFDIGNIVGTDLIGQTTLRTGIKAQVGKGKIRTYAQIDSVIVEKLHVNGYNYSGIAGAGTVAEEAFNGTIICNDPSLNFMFQGAFALSPKTHNSRYDFFAVLGHADLNAMNLDKRGISEIQCQTRADFTRTKSGDIFGKIDIAGLTARNDQGVHAIGDINMTSHSSDTGFKARLNSRFADLMYSGSAAMTQFMKDLQNITLKKEIPSLYKDPEYEWEGNQYEVSMRFHNSMNLLNFLMPGLYIADSTSFNATIDKDGILDSRLTSSRIAFKEQYLKDLKLTFENKADNLKGELSAKEMKVANVSLKDNSLQLLAEDDHVGAGYSYDNNDALINKGEFIMVGDVTRDDKDDITLGLNVRPSRLYLNSKEWNILPAEMYLSNGEVDIRSFELTSGEQRVSLKGKTSKTQTDTLELSLDRFNISIINPLFKENLDFKGAMTGEVRLTSPLETKGLLANLVCDSTHIAGLPLGILTIGSEWDEDFERFNITLKNSHEGRSNIDLNGKLTPKIRTIEGTAVLDRLNIGYVQPLLDDIFSEMSGSISGKINIDGLWESFDISSEDARLNDAMLRIGYTNVPYHADGRFHLDAKGVYFDDISITDNYSGNGTVTGSINYDHFRDISFDMKMRANDMQCINLSESQGDVFYGNVFATGNISMTGPIESILMNVDAVTSRAGQIHIPLNTISSATGSTNLLKFTERSYEEYIDPYEIMIRRFNTKQISQSAFDVRLKVNASPDVEAFLEIDKASGNILSGRGSGTIDLEVTKDIFNINGDYTLSSGKYKFVAAGIASRDFEIQNGSSVRFNGDILESTLDIDAIYKTKTSLSTLISDTTSVSNRRTVDCGIRITDKLSNPRLEFSIEIPDLDPTIKSRVESALSTEDKVQKQFLSLILTNSFLPDEQSGIVNNSSMIYSSMTEIMANQLNNIFQKLDIPLDLGMKYQPNERGNDIFDVAVSTQLFNNRVVVNGNIGNKQQTSGTQNDVVGDLDIEIKLDRSGAFRLNLFSHSADQYTNFLDNSQRNGAGLTYQTEFNTFGKFLRNIFSSKKRRQQAKLAEEQAIIEEGRDTIEIKDNNDGDK